MKKWLPAALAMLLLSPLFGCAGAANYIGNRCADLADMITLEATIGPITDVHFQATSFFGTGFGSSKQWGFVMRGRHIGLGGRDSSGILLMASSHTSGTLLFPLYGDAEYVDKDMTLFPLVVRFPPIEPILKRSEWPDLLDVEAGASLIVGVHVGVSVVEVLDFVVGLTTLDMCGDDYHPEPELPPPPPTPGPAAFGPGEDIRLPGPA